MEQIRGDAIWNDDIPETSDEESEENEGTMRVKLPKARLVDAEQEAREYDEHMAEKLAVVHKFVLPRSHSEYTIAAPPSPGSLSDLKSRWALLKQKVIAHKSHDG